MLASERSQIPQIPLPGGESAANATEPGTPRGWREALDASPLAACIVDARLIVVVGANARAHDSGVLPGMPVDTALTALFRPDTSGALRWRRLAEAEAGFWLVEAASDEPASAPGDETERNATAAQRLAAANLRLQQEIAERRRLERQVLTVAESEKQRISLELHDGLGQHLTGLSFVARTLADKLRGANHEEAGEADFLVRLLNEAIARTRAMARGLWPVSLERDSLGQSIAKLAEDLESLFGVSCVVQIVDEPTIASQFVAHHVFRIVQEAATNAIKHGRARRLTFRLEMVGEEFTVCVLNDGLPVDLAELESGKGLGVVAMRLRADAVGGHLSIEPLPSGGCEVTLALPGVSGVPTHSRGEET